MIYLKAFETNELGPKVGDYIYVNIDKNGHSKHINFPIGIYHITGYYPESKWCYAAQQNDENETWFSRNHVLVWGKTKEDVEKQLIQKRFDL